MLPLQKKKQLVGNGIAFLRFGAWKYPTAVIRKTFRGEYIQGMHFHDFPQVWYCHGGSYRHQIGTRVYDCEAGSFFVVPAGVDHGFIVPADCEADIFCIEVKYSLYVDTPPGKSINAMSNLLLPCFGKELGYSFPEHYQLGERSQEKAAAYLSDLAMLDYTTDEMQMDLIYRRLEDLFSLPELRLPEKYHKKAIRLVEQKAQPIVRTLVYMNDHYAGKIVAEDLLWVAALCHTDFYKCFKRFTALTFSDYLLQLRTSRVTILLRSTTYSFSRIAELCGFGDAAHMSKSYKKATGKLLKDVRGGGRVSAKKAEGADHRLRDKDAV